VYGITESGAVSSGNRRGGGYWPGNGEKNCCPEDRVIITDINLKAAEETLALPDNPADSQKYRALSLDVTRRNEVNTIDGSFRMQSFFRLTIPMMMPTFLAVILLRTITALRTYDLVYVLTRGGPGTSTEVISYNIYQQAFRYTRTGMASAMSYLLLIAIIPIAALFIYFSKNKTT
jgi:hypothetical protein